MHSHSEVWEYGRIAIAKYGCMAHIYSGSFHVDLSGARKAGELHALADSLNEEIDKLDSGDLDVQAQRMAKTLED